MSVATTVLVTDGQLRPSLAVVRSLGRAGHRVVVCSSRRRSLAGASRFAADEARVPDPLTAPTEYVDAVVELTSRWHVDVLLPISEESLLGLLPAAARMPAVRLPFPSLDVFRSAADKAHVTALAATLGIAVPDQVVVHSRDEIIRLRDAALLSFPIVVKPGRSVADTTATRTKLGVAYAMDEAELERLLTTMPDAAYPLLLQRRIEGPGTGVFLLLWNGQLLATFAHRRIREKPPTGGVSVCAESIALDPETLAQAEALLSALDWRGAAMVEFKQDRHDGRHYLMEINGRFWGSLQLAVDAGVDFPALLVAAAMGEPSMPAPAYRVGVRCRWWWGEVDHLLARVRRPDEAPRDGGRMRAVREFLLPGAGVRNEVLRADDPWPFARESLDWLRGR
ncbi:MAG TPA: ATP-grasp domain-containing protein [Gemmatimonadaceae bacterium]|nr:ATP-grasp domain-containing protein [Gemmatimonadaceae bacterium]